MKAKQTSTHRETNMNEIVKKTQLNPIIHEIVVNSPLIAKKGEPGQFVILRLDERGERFPLTLADTDKENETITLVFQVTGKSTLELSMAKEGDVMKNIVGPLGRAAEIEKFGTVVLVGGGCGVAPVYPQARALKQAGNKVISIIGFKNKDAIFWKDKMEAVSDEVIVTTDDGSFGFKGFTTTALQELIDKGVQVDRVISIGPLIMMANTVKVTRPHDIKTIVSLNAIMVDGTGMCGSCRVTTSKGIQFSCVDGPDMDGFDIDFTELMNRNRKYKQEEEISLKHFKHECKCGSEVEKCE